MSCKLVFRDLRHEGHLESEAYNILKGEKSPSTFPLTKLTSLVWSRFCSTGEWTAQDLAFSMSSPSAAMIHRILLFTSSSTFSLLRRHCLPTTNKSTHSSNLAPMSFLSLANSSFSQTSSRLQDGATGLGKTPFESQYQCTTKPSGFDDYVW